MMTHPDLPAGDPHDLLHGYLVDALDADEAQRFVSHLSTCAPCRHELRAFSSTIEELASANPVNPPDALEDRLMASVFADESPAQLHAPAHRQRMIWRLPLAAAAALVLLLGLGAGIALVMHQDTTTQFVAEEATQQILEVTGAPDAHFMPLNLAQGDAKLVVSMQMNKAVVMGSDLPMPKEGEAYHVWTVMDDGSVVSAAEFMPDAQGHASAMLDTGVQGATGFKLTVDDHGAVRPTGSVLGGVDL